VFPYVHQGWWIDTGKPLDMLEANSYVLEEIPEHAIRGTVDAESTVDARVTVEEGAVVERSVIRGPAIIGRNTVIRDSYIGPFTSIYHDVEIVGSELARCIVLENSRVLNIPQRIEDSLIGRNATLQYETRKPRAIKLNLGDHSRIWLP
ncbi:MAG: glucose-1-phosphate thymidylyltransferase, partial [Chloroflexi bacterium]|nr:glucose-1-phosphate thymidylyltransferase [Chloroflexota bacterium]